MGAMMYVRSAWMVHIIARLIRCCHDLDCEALALIPFYTRVNIRMVTVGGYVRNDSGERENCNTKCNVLRFSFPLGFAHTHQW